MGVNLRLPSMRINCTCARRGMRRNSSHFKPDGCGGVRSVDSVAHMRVPPPLGQAEYDEIHWALDDGPPSAGCGRRSGPSAPARKGRVHLH